VSRNRIAFFPECAAGGFSRRDGSIDFYSRVSSLVNPGSVVLDYGAGRGARFSDDGYRARLANLKGRVARLVGADVDEIVLKNPYVDEAYVIELDTPLEFADATFDLIYSDWVLEHIATPELFAAEVHRLLKPGGWFCARTPNRWGIKGIGANLLPNHLHAKIMSRLQPGRQEIDVFPTTYLMNTRRRLRRFFPPSQWDDFSYMHSPEPVFLARSKVAFGLSLVYLRLAPDGLASNLHVFMRKGQP
jgi:SAM-dependent methyltransferase